MNNYQVFYECDDGTKGEMPVGAPSPALAIEVLLHRIGGLIEEDERITFWTELVEE